MKQLLNKIKTLLRERPASISGGLTVIITNLVTLGIFDISADKAAAITSLLTIIVMAVANILAPTQPALSTDEVDYAVDLQRQQGGGE